MGLQKSQAIEVLKKPKNSEALDRAKGYEDRVNLHSVANMNENFSSTALTGVKEQIMKGIQNEKKRERINGFLRPPFDTVELSNSIFTETEKIFDSQNPFFDYEFTNDTSKTDYVNYLNTQLKDHEFFQTEGFNAFKEAINSVLVVDLPSEQRTERPEPYYYLVNLDSMIDVSVDKKGNVVYFAFKFLSNGRKMAAVYDDEYYRVFDVTDGLDKIVTIVENTHDLGYAPASFFWFEFLNKREDLIAREHILSKSATRLDWLLIYTAYKRYTDETAPFPIFTGFESACDYSEFGATCENGQLIWEDAVTISGIRYPNGHVKNCPKCSDKEELGAGTFIKVPVPQRDDDPDLRNPISVINADVENLQFIDEQVDKLNKHIYKANIGRTVEVSNDQAKNEKQILAGLESETVILQGIAKGFEKIHKFANDTVARLRYGNLFVSSTIFYGRQYFLKTVQQLTDEYERAKESSMPDEEVDAIYKQLVATKYRGNNDQIERSIILMNVNPHPHKSIESVKLMLDSGLTSQENYLIKYNLAPYTTRFERENGSIIEFGSALQFERKIEIILETFKSYANESKDT